MTYRVTSLARDGLVEYAVFIRFDKLRPAKMVLPVATLTLDYVAAAKRASPDGRFAGRASLWPKHWCFIFVKPQDLKLRDCRALPEADILFGGPVLHNFINVQKAYRL